VTEASQALAQVRERIQRAAGRAGRSPEQVKLVGVIKGQPLARVVEAVAAGLDRLGESFAQEARGRRGELLEAFAGRGVPEPEWHFIGQLQRNKARSVVPLFDAVHSVDRLALATELDRRAAAAGRRLRVLIQVNLSHEGRKGGVAEPELPRLVDEVGALPHLDLEGLMTIPAAHPDPERARPVFARLRELAWRLSKQPGGGKLRELSMGMSGDFEVAIEEGATLVRIGTALFGPRGSRTP